MKTIKIAGVPEHFNLPWHLCLENKEFETQNIDLQWTDVPEGTGKMCQMLRDGETDIAVILSEGIVKDILTSAPRHHRGIKVRLEDGQIGRVKEIVAEDE